MTTKYHQISLKDTFSDCQDMFIDDTPSFFQLLNEHFDIAEFIPSAFYQHLSRDRLYSLEAFLSAFILQKIFSIPTDALLILFLRLCKELRYFCGFPRFPTLLSFPGSNPLLCLILNSCFKKWWITPNLSVT